MYIIPLTYPTMSNETNNLLQHIKSILQANEGRYDSLSADGIPLVLDSVDPNTDDNISIVKFHLNADGDVIVTTSEGNTINIALLDDEDDLYTIDEIISDAFNVPYLYP